MPSVLPGYEYDIFISYRQKDNKYDGWVTSFVDDLQRELEATFKKEVSVYFDMNPHHGLHEMHDVDESLKEKIKCIIFIPIISQTYCDPNSFAWQHEFLAFRDFTKRDQFGPKVKVAGGNFSSRILPVCIHELDEEDKQLFEREVGGPLRSIDFIFSAAGVNRPLGRDDHASDNINKTLYRDQINKVAQSIKQIIAGLRLHEAESLSAEVVPATEQKNPILSSPPRDKTKLFAKVSLFTLVTAILVFAGYYYLINSNSPSLISSDKIAVLPFVNLSGNPDNEYFTDGITEDIITLISKISDLRVISRSSVIQYKNTNKDIAEIGNELGVEMILEGTVRLTGNRSRITANLINAVSREQIWAESYDKEIKDLFKVQAEVARDIVAALNANLSESKGHDIPTDNLKAYDLYLKANYHFEKATKEGYRTSVALAKQATELDNDFALAFARLADCYSLIAYYQFDDIMPLEEARQKSILAAKKAIEIDPLLAAGYNAYAYALRTHLWQWAESEKQILKASSLEPDNSNIRRRYSLLLGVLGRFDEALVQLSLAHEIDPIGSIYNSDQARMAYYAGQIDKSLELAQYTFTLEPEYRPAMGIMAIALERSGLLDSSVFWVCKSKTRTATDYEGLPEEFESKRKPYKLYWKDVLDRSLEDIKEKHIPSMAMALIFMRNGNHEGALEYLEKGYQNKEGSMVYINAEPIFDPLHSDPRFKEIIKGMGLPAN